MSVDLSKLSAKELYELAQKKEKEEQEAAERQGKIDALMQQREAMTADHKNILLLTDKKIREMQEKRDAMVTEHVKELNELDKEIESLGGTLPNKTAKGNGEDRDKIKSTLRQVMNKRPYISASLLKEKLASYGIKPGNFNQELEQWVKDGWFISKGKGNYALGNKI